jgi:regulator of ribosome biosynthesis
MAASSSYQVDPGNLSISETSFVSGPQRDEDELAEEATKAVRLLFGELLALPTQLKKYDPNEAAVEVHQLPQPVLRLPREKAPPKEKPLTAWQKFALKKGIALSRKKGNKEWDEARQEWRDRWGKRAREQDDAADWLREVKPGHVAEEEGGDPFLEARREKQSALKLQQKKAERNRRREDALASSSAQLKELDRTMRTVTTASMGKFDAKAAAPSRRG